MRRFLFALVVALAALPLTAVEPPAGADAPLLAAEKEQLARVQQLVGAWRGVGQPRRGSTQGSWVEEADWAWAFDKAGAALVAKLPKGKYFTELRVEPADDTSNPFVLLASGESGKAKYAGSLDDDGRLVFTASEPHDDYPARISFRFVAGGDRMLIFLERKNAADQFARLAEVGYTRQGSAFGQGSTGRECVVTGGAGTIEVRYEGKTYYVCCTGCRDYFNENPAEVLAEYAARKEAEKAKK